MKNYIIILFTMFCIAHISAQNLVSGEYFFNTDPGVGNAIALPSFSPSDTINSTLALPTTGLSTGFHHLFIRYKDSDNKWGIYEGRSFYVAPANSNPMVTADLITAEYFYDTDPGVGNATALPSFLPSDTINSTLALPTTGLSTGFHHLFIRYKDSDNKWGIYEGRSFYIAPANSNPLVAADLITAEYFFDTDPGVGNAIALPSFSPSDTINSNLNISIAGLSTGFHDLFIRYKDADNKWGIYEGREFEVVTCNVPVANFTAASTTICIGDTAFFTDNSTNTVAATIYAWDFNNDGTIESTNSGNQSYYYSTVGTYVVKLKLDHLGCIDSSLVTINVVAPTSTIANINICSGNAYTFPDGTTQSNITTNVSQVSNLQSVFGCDSIITTNISVKPVYNQTSTVFVCSGENYTFADGSVQNNINSSLIHTSNLSSINNCDSILVTTVNLFSDYNTTTAASVCSGNSYTFLDGFVQNNITSTVSHSNNFQTINGCDSIITTTVSLFPDYNLTESVGICIGSSFTFPDGFTQNNITATTSHTSNLSTINSCDSIIVTNLTITSNYQFSEIVSVCSGDAYTFPDGSMQSNILTQVVYSSTLTGVGSCDTIMQTTVNVNPIYNTSETLTVCSGDNYIFADGTSQNNITATVVHTNNLTTVNNCDSIVITTVNVNPTYSQTETFAVCSGESFTFSDGSIQNNITTTVVYTNNLTTINNCDSIIVTTIDVNPIYNLTETVNVCAGSSYTFPDGTVQNNLTSNVVHTSSLHTMNGCDSIIVTNVNVSNVYNASESVTICSGESYTFPDGTIQNNITAPVSYTSNITSATSCDTAMLTNVLVNPIYSETETVEVCSGGSYTFPDGTVQNNITATVVYTSSLTSINSCDSTIETTVNVEEVDASISEIGNTLTANISNEIYQWFDCSTNLAIDGATSQNFSPSTNGEYSVMITINNCSETSECFKFISTGIENLIENSISIYPNPVSAILIIDYNKDVKVEVMNVLGKKILQSNQKQINVEKFAAGVYFLNIYSRNNEIISVNKFVKE